MGSKREPEREPHFVVIGSHPADDSIKDRLVAHLEQCDLSVWHEGKIEPGDERDREIQRALERATVAVLLISVDFLNSPLYRDLLQGHLYEKWVNRRIRIIPVVVRHCIWPKDSILSRLEPWNRGNPLWREEDLDGALTSLVGDVANQPAIVRETDAEQMGKLISATEANRGKVPGIGPTAAAPQMAPEPADFQIIGGDLSTARWVAERLQRSGKSVAFAQHERRSGRRQVVIVTGTTKPADVKAFLDPEKPVLAILMDASNSDSVSAAEWLNPEALVVFAGKSEEQRERDLARALGGEAWRAERPDLFIAYADEDTGMARWLDDVMWNANPRRTCVYAHGDFAAGGADEGSLEEAARAAEAIAVIHSRNFASSRYSRGNWPVILKRRCALVLSLDGAVPPEHLRGAAVVNGAQDQRRVIASAQRAVAPLHTRALRALGVKARIPATILWAPIQIALFLLVLLAGGKLYRLPGVSGAVDTFVVSTAKAAEDSADQALNWNRFRIEPGVLFQGFMGPDGDTLNLNPSGGAVLLMGFQTLISSLGEPNGTLRADLSFRERVSLVTRALGANRHYEVRWEQSGETPALSVWLHSRGRRERIQPERSWPVKFRPGERNTFALTAHGSYFRTSVNGNRAAQWRNPELAAGAAGIRAESGGVRFFGGVYKPAIRVLTAASQPW